MAHAADTKSKAIGKLLREQRKDCGMTIAAAASLAEVSEDWWRQIEAGYPSGRGPSVRVLERAANAVGLTVTLSKS
jgi:transcriptional regulator with XRE-family HTH domain